MTEDGFEREARAVTVAAQVREHYHLKVSLSDIGKEFSRLII